MSFIASGPAFGGRVTSTPARPRLKTVFWLDVTLLVLVCALETVPFTGLVLHEWLGLALVVLVAAHLLLSWAWIASKTRRLFTAGSLRTRVNYSLNLALFACMTAVVFSGILISQYALPRLTGGRPADLRMAYRWDHIHGHFSDFIVVLVGLHLAINWDWSLAAARRILRREED